MIRVPLQHQPAWKRALTRWFDPRGRSTGFIAFALNRITAIGLTVYLLLHLVVLSTLMGGEAGWNAFITLAKTPVFLLLDVILIAGILIHGLNGIRVALVGMGFGTNNHKALFWGLMAVAVLLLAYSGWLVFAIE